MLSILSAAFLISSCGGSSLDDEISAERALRQEAEQRAEIAENRADSAEKRVSTLVVVGVLGANRSQ